MRYAIVSDIHANLQAWNTVLADIKVQKVDRIICLGDIVGYGPRPAEVLASVYAHVPDIVIGNHDAVVAGRLDSELFREDAQRMILWTKDQLDKKAITLFQSLGYTIDYDDFSVSHADFTDPESFHYLIDEPMARASWEVTEAQLLFIGHTHIPKIHMLTQKNLYKEYTSLDFEIEHDNRYIVNVGSVGMPRDGDTRSSYCVYDSDTKSVTFHRISYDFDSFRKDVKRIIGSSEQTDLILGQFDSAQSIGNVREFLDFSSSQESTKTRKRTKTVMVRSAKNKQAPTKSIRVSSGMIQDPVIKKSSNKSFIAIIFAAIIIGVGLYFGLKKSQKTDPPVNQNPLVKKMTPDDTEENDNNNDGDDDNDNEDTENGEVTENGETDEPKNKVFKRYIPDWVALGPIGYKDFEKMPENQLEAHQFIYETYTEKTPHEARKFIDLQSSYITHYFGARHIFWQEIHTDKKIVLYPKIDSLKKGISLTYYSTWIFSQAMNEFKLTFWKEGNDKFCDIEAWLNGQSLRRGSGISTPYNVELKRPVRNQVIELEKGWNHLYVKMITMKNGPLLGVKITHKDKVELDKLKFSNKPPKVERKKIYKYKLSGTPFKREETYKSVQFDNCGNEEESPQFVKGDNIEFSNKQLPPILKSYNLSKDEIIYQYKDLEKGSYKLKLRFYNPLSSKISQSLWINDELILQNLKVPIRKAFRLIIDVKATHIVEKKLTLKFKANTYSKAFISAIDLMYTKSPNGDKDAQETPDDK
ncbi:MAG: metallophosphoesterase family protein [Lentisphaeria bacterium]|nr:metallophosphatase family protein [Lentisphaeria bacterium]NQZ69198.1 metallophosphoesterase family protein [Lentisphaeria bacterium]